MTLETTGQFGEVMPRGLPGLDVIQDWVKAASAVSTLVRPLVLSDFVPKSFKADMNALGRNADPEERQRAYDAAAGNAIAAVLYGMSLGLDPLVSLQQIYVVHGRPGMYSKMKVALAQAAGHDVWDEAYSADRAVVCGRRKGWPEDRIVRIEITIEMAKTAGWTTNATYTKTPADMLWNRAAGRVVDRIASDLLQGIQSIEDIEPQEDRPPAAAPTTAAAIRARIAPAESVSQSAAETAAVVRDLVADVDGALPAALGPEPLAPRTWDAINRKFVELEVIGDGQKAQRLAVISHILGRPIGRGSEMTADEGHVVLDNLTFQVVELALGTTPARTESAATQPEDEHDPTMAPGWGQHADGADAGGEA
jgi:hypothetical protein